MKDIQFRIIFGGIGAILLANALVAIIMSQVSRRYSFEYYQNSIIGQQQKELDRLQQQQFGTLQQPSYMIQPEASGVEQVMGPAVAGNVNVMNQWQGQPSHAGAFVPPQENVQPYNGVMPGMVEDAYYRAGIDPRAQQQNWVPEQKDPNWGGG